MSETTGLLRPAQWLMDWFNGWRGGDKAKVQVNNFSMMGSAAIWYAMQTISGDLAKMPLEVRRTPKGGRGSEVYSQHAGYRLFRDEPNSFQTSDVFKEQIQAHALGWGDGRAAIIRRGGMVTELIPLMPDRTETLMVEGAKYHVTCPNEDDPLRFAQVVSETVQTGRIASNMIVLPDSDVLHILGFTYNGFSGLNIARYLHDAIGVGLQSSRLSMRQLRNGLTAKVLLSDGGNVFRGADAEANARKFLEEFRDQYTAEMDGHGIGLLRQQMTAQVLNMSNSDAQLIEQMRFSRQDVMLIFGLQHIPGDNSSVSYNSLEQKQLAYLQCLDRWLTRWEMQCDAKLRSTDEKKAREVYFKFNRRTWLQMDANTTANVLTKYVQSEVMSRNEAREKLDLNPYDGGDEFKNPAINPAQNGKDTEESVAAKKLKELVAVEGRKVVEIATSKKSTSVKAFEDGIAAFYAKWQVTMQTAFSEVGSDFDCDYYVQERHKEIAAAVARSDGDFANHIVALVSEWHNVEGWFV